MLFLYFCISSGRFTIMTIICLKKVFLNTDFYFVYNIYISEKCLTQMGIKEYIRDLFSLLQLNLVIILNGITFILQYMFKLSFFWF